jgi:hypothetical protein
VKDEMTEIAAEPPPRPVLADYPGALPFLSTAAAAAIGGIFWFPLWFFAAQLLRLWAPRGGMTWLNRRGVSEYTDERYATAIAWGPFVPIVLRILVSFNWLEPFQVLVSRHLDSAPTGEWTVLLDVVLGATIALSLTAVLTTGGLARVISLAGFLSMAGLSLVIAFRPPLAINGFALVPLVFVGWSISALAEAVNNAPKRRARRAARQAARIEDERIEAQERRERGY